LNEAKPFQISKKQIWDAFKRVRANRGAAGVDGQSISDFEEDLKNNLYKVWNRLSSGSYFPPPVRRVEIPKGDGKKRPLGACRSINDSTSYCFLHNTLFLQYFA
jgi:retron-type reverse transcriptase